MFRRRWRRRSEAAASVEFAARIERADVEGERDRLGVAATD